MGISIGGARNTTPDLYSNPTDSFLFRDDRDADKFQNTICANAVDPDSFRDIKQYINSSLEKIADFHGDASEYEALACSIVFYVCKIIKNASADKKLDVDLNRIIPTENLFELKKKLNRAGGADDNKTKYPPAVIMMKTYIEENYNEAINLLDLAEITGLSPNYSGKLFREYTGLSVPDYVNRFRISKACGLLRQTNMKIYQIAYHIGYSEACYFSQLFKKIMKVTPIEYRKNPETNKILPLFNNILELNV